MWLLEIHFSTWTLQHARALCGGVLIATSLSNVAVVLPEKVLRLVDTGQQTGNYSGCWDTTEGDKVELAIVKNSTGRECLGKYAWEEPAQQKGDPAKTL